MTYNCVCGQDFYGQEDLPTYSQVALSIITIVGLSLSIAGLSATVLSFLCIKQVYCDSFAADWITAFVTDMTAATGFAITTDSVVMKSLHVAVIDPHEDHRCTQRAFRFAITTDSVVMKSLQVSVIDPHEDQRCTQRAFRFVITTDFVVMKSLHVAVIDPHEDQRCTQRAFGFIHRISETGCCCCRVSATRLVGSLLFLFRLAVILRSNCCLGGDWFVVDWSDCLGWSNYCTVNRRA